MVKLLWLSSLVLASGSVPAVTDFSLKSVEYDWAEAERSEALASGDFIPSNNVITGIKVCNEEIAPRCHEEKVFVTVPRWLPGVPGTLNMVVNHENRSGPLLRPWPSRDAQDPRDCTKIQYVQSMEIDPDGVMWIIDVGRKYFNDAAASDNTCPPKMVLIDVMTESILDTYVFPSDVAPYTGSFLNDIVIDVQRQIAYISSTGNNATDLGALVVFDRLGRRSRRFEHQSTHAEDEVFMIHDQPNEGIPCDGIALTPSGDAVFYSALSGYHLYSVSAAELRNFSVPASEVASTVVDHGRKPSNSDGMAFGLDGSLFFGGLTTDSVYRWTPQMGDASNAEVLQTNVDELYWVDTFAFDNRGDLLLTSNRLNSFLSGEMDFQDDNFRVIRMTVGTGSYMSRGLLEPAWSV